MSSSYNCDKGRAPMGKISAGKPRPTKVIKTSSGSNFRSPTASQKPWSSQGGSKK